VRHIFIVASVVLALARPSLAQPSSGKPWLLITDSKVLAALEAGGASLSSRLGGAARQSNRALLANPIYASLLLTLEKDLADLRIRDPQLQPGLRGTHRLFDTAFLRAETTRFELVGMVNRLDRRPFAPQHCGELRLVYRLVYAIPQGTVVTQSRLPMTVNLVYFARDDRGGTDCLRVASLLREPPDQLLASPLLQKDRLKSLEVNLQSVRWPSTVRPDLAGHAEYLLRAFHLGPEGRGLVPSPLENTPDVERVKGDAALRKALLAWLSAPENLARIDEGTAVLPDRFLAPRATSFSPRGLARLANRPFRQLFAPAELSHLDLKNRRYVRSPVALLRRLDGLSCAGCHQSRSVAGFHLIGTDQSDPTDSNGILVAASPHLTFELSRREHYVQAMLDGKQPDASRPPAERADSGEGGYGSHCGLSDIGLAGWTCHSGFTCTSIDETEAGICLPAKAEVGDPCQIGVVREHADSHRDRISEVLTRACPDSGTCQSNYAGFPTGMCSVSCDALGEHAACGGIPQLRGFNDCLAKRRPFSTCIRDNIRPSGLRSCDDKTPCRDDYICARAKDAQGVCMPPYFLFQMRVDGHAPP
jgi:hypothetical protein